MDAKVSIKTKTFQNLNKNCPLALLVFKESRLNVKIQIQIVEVIYCIVHMYFFL